MKKQLHIFLLDSQTDSLTHLPCLHPTIFLLAFEDYAAMNNSVLKYCYGEEENEDRGKITEEERLIIHPAT